MRLLRMKFYISFMKVRRLALLASTVAIVASICLLAFKGLNLGIDFSGGVLVQMETDEVSSVGDVRQALEKVGLGASVIQAYSEKGYIIRIKSEESQEEALRALRESFPNMSLLRLEQVGPIVGSQLRRQAVIAVSISLVCILIYITFRFRFRFGAVSVLALFHDVIITLGLFSLTGREISLPFIAAILTIVGYSLNDTIVVLDRVRENWRHLRQWGITKLLDDSINQTLSRTINTSLTTFFPVLALFLWGGPAIADFSFAFMVGIVVGTYSSIFIAGALLCEWQLRSPKT
jgi:preprotein translocase subunit SecF